ncbi:MAG: hypothetical protein JNK67_05535 [Alphaproteobacteria bacterium]|nr:hypothetical protein [Alphaproteobacteria bacterium]
MTAPDFPLAADTLATLRRAMLPMDGSIADHAEPILAAVAAATQAVPLADLAYVDLTAGSCLLPMAFAAAGARRVVVNDTASRTQVAAQALFGGAPADAETMVRRAAAATAPRRQHVASFRFIADHLTRDVAEIFDRLYFALAPAAEAMTARYVALRWVLGFADDEDGFRILMTHDPAQLRADDEEDWRGFLDRARRPSEIIAAVSRDIAAGQGALRTRDVAILHGDMRDVAGAIDYSGPTLVAVNPPTNGVDEYVIDDQVVHSLIANRLVPLTKCGESAAAFWRSRVEIALDALPRGTFFLVWGGDGALSSEDCRATWTRFGDPVHLATVVPSPGRHALWGIFRRR